MKYIYFIESYVIIELQLYLKFLIFYTSKL